MTKKIDIQCPDDDISVDGGSFDRLYIYRSILSLLADVKITQGPTGVNATLRRHPVISSYLLNFQKDTILKLEGKINLLTE